MIKLESMYIAIKNNTAYKFESTIGLCISLFTVEINDKGEVRINNIVDSISYNMQEYTKEEAFKDFCNRRLPKIIDRFGYELYHATPI